MGTSSHDQALPRQEIPCRDPVSTAYTSLCRDKERSCRDIKFLVASALYHDRILSIATEFYLSRQMSPVAHAPLSCAPKACRALLTWSIAPSWSGLSCAHDLPYRGQICCDLKIICRDRNSPYPSQLHRDIKLLCRDIISPCIGQLCRNLNYSVETEFLLALANSVMT